MTPMFCRNCGTRISDGAKFCASCGAGIETQTTAPQPKMPVVPGRTASRLRKKRFMDVLLMPVAIILILMGIGYIGLTVAGRPVTAQVTGYEQVLIVNNNDSTRNQSRYKLEYAFSVNGERYTGSVTRVFAGESHMRQTIPVRYLPFWPHVNAEDGGAVGFSGPIMMGLGVLLLVFVVKRTKTDRRPHHKGQI